jgi:hypothetical protein
MKLKIHRMNDNPEIRNGQRRQNLRKSRAAPRPPFVPHNLGAPVTTKLGNNSLGNNQRTTQHLLLRFLGLLGYL